MDKTLFIFIITYIVIAIGQTPVFRVDRAGSAIIGAGLMIILGSLSEQDAFLAIDYKTIIILFGMMIVVANLRLSGFFNLIIGFILKRLNNPKTFLKLLIFVSALLSAFFVNDTVCLMFTPFVLDICEHRKINPKPFLIALCMASNIGSVATLTGNPQNIIIGTAGKIPYMTFFLKMLPVSVCGCIILYFVISLFYKNELLKNFTTSPLKKIRYNRPLTIKTILVSIVVIFLFMIGLPMEIVSLGAGCFLLVTRRIKPEKVYNLIDFRLLVFFIGLFIIIKALENSQIATKFLHDVGVYSVSNLWLFTLISVILSNIVSNVPAVLIFKPILNIINANQIHWIILAMSSTLAGNLTILGSIANIIVIEGASGRAKISFIEYSKIGFPVTVLSILVGMIIIVLETNLFA